MLVIRPPGPVLRLTTVVIACAYLGACTGWRELAPQSTQQMVFDSTKTYRLTLSSGDRLVAQHPHVSGDSLVWIPSTDKTTWVGQPRSKLLALADIRQAEVQQGEPLLTAVTLMMSAFLVYELGANCNCGTLSH